VQFGSGCWGELLHRSGVALAPFPLANFQFQEGDDGFAQRVFLFLRLVRLSLGETFEDRISGQKRSLLV
jgi:hypothetical protein